MTEPVLEEGAEGAESCGAVCDDLNRLMNQAMRGHRLLLTSLLAEIDLYPGQERVMSLLWERGPQSQNVLAKLLGIDVSTMTKTLQRLERSGFISRSPSPANRRVSIVETTPKGDALRPEIERILTEVHRRMTLGLTPEQTETLSSLLEVVQVNLCREVRANPGLADGQGPGKGYPSGEGGRF
ncbi:MarR family winged helix-turn-helix transcriptional regulator [Streptosporangium sp. NPDC000396]|uniref:MarR family winged helix-turn-helix transcriptional regulator n=1 Tax=Streptosporangium sp. NPDC000396 TaxID=3366185 RepID=UPI003683A274